MIPTIQRKTLLVGLCLVLLSSCATQMQPQTQYFTISSDTAAEFSLPQPVRVSRVRIPDYIDNDRLWVRTQAQQLSSMAGARWAEAIGAAITRELSSSLGIGLTEDSSWPLLLVNIDRLEAQWNESGDVVVLVARWALEDEQDESPVGGQIRLRESIAERTPNAVAKATATAVATMNQRIGSELTTYLRS